MSRDQTGRSAAADVDLRRFKYVLEPVAQRQRWRVDAAQSHLAGVQGQVLAARNRLADTDAQRQAVAALAASGAGASIDPRAHRLVLASLWQLDRRRQAESEALQALEDELQAARRACAEAQLRLEGLDRHRDEERHGFALDAQRRQVAESDREWLARRPATGSRP